jgi:hypothetical protein
VKTAREGLWEIAENTFKNCVGPIVPGVGKKFGGAPTDF